MTAVHLFSTVHHAGIGQRSGDHSDCARTSGTGANYDDSFARMLKNLWAPQPLSFSPIFVDNAVGIEDGGPQ